MHVDGSYNKIWPISLIMQIMTSNDDNEIKNLLEILKKTHANTFYMHESFNSNE